MEIFEWVLSGLFALGFLSIGYIQKNFLTNYMDEKGKNQAIKEDIQKITTIVEEVKSNFLSDTEILKSKLSILSNTQISLLSEERNAIIEFNKCYFEWYHLITCPHISENCTNIEELDKYLENMDEKHSNVRRYSAVFDLYVDNNLCEKKTLLVSETSTYVLLFLNRYLFKLRSIRINLAELTQKLKGPFPEQERQILIEEKRMAEIANRKSVGELLDKLAIADPKLVNEQRKFKQECKTYLKKLFQDS